MRMLKLLINRSNLKRSRPTEVLPLADEMKPAPKDMADVQSIPAEIRATLMEELPVYDEMLGRKLTLRELACILLDKEYLEQE